MPSSIRKTYYQAEGRDADGEIVLRKKRVVNKPDGWYEDAKTAREMYVGEEEGESKPIRSANPSEAERQQEDEDCAVETHEEVVERRLQDDDPSHGNNDSWVYDEASPYPEEKGQAIDRTSSLTFPVVGEVLIANTITHKIHGAGSYVVLLKRLRNNYMDFDVYVSFSDETFNTELSVASDHTPRAGAIFWDKPRKVPVEIRQAVETAIKEEDEELIRHLNRCLLYIRSGKHPAIE